MGVEVTLNKDQLGLAADGDTGPHTIILPLAVGVHLIDMTNGKTFTASSPYLHTTVGNGQVKPTFVRKHDVPPHLPSPNFDVAVSILAGPVNDLPLAENVLKPCRCAVHWHLDVFEPLPRRLVERQDPAFDEAHVSDAALKSK